MKVLVHFEGTKIEQTEGARMRKTIKGALELHEIKYTTTVLDTFDVAHFISPDDMLKIHLAMEANKPIIVSALYTEDDDSARFLDYKRKLDGTSKVILKPKALRLLNSANLVMVPTEKAREQLINYGVTSEIKVVYPGVNLARFDFSREDEKEIFYRYFREDKSKRLVICFGGPTPAKEGIGTFINAAKANPNAIFYYLAPYSEEKLHSKLRNYILRAPKNAKFKGILLDDVRRSALLNADVVLLSTYTPAGVVSISEAMAAKCQIIARDGAAPSDLLINGKNAYLGKFSETLVSLVTDYLNNQLQPTIENAYTEISKHDLQVFGNDIIKIYNEQISLKK